MRALFAVYKREVALYFKSFIAYGITFALMIFLGLYFQGRVASVVQQTAQGAPAPPAANLASSMLGIFVFLMFVISPVLTMRLLSEESREGTLELLMTLPMSDWVFVVGKFLAAWTFYTFLLALTLVHVLLLWNGNIFEPMNSGNPINPGVFFVAYLGAWLYGGTTMAVSMIWSALTEDQLVAAFLGVTSVLILYLAADLGNVFAGGAIGNNVAEIIRELGLTTHYHATMLEGLLRAEDIAYFVLMIAVSLFITILIVGTRRWRSS
ncbi:MAG: ABC transporter permease [Chloroflexota bacterium]